MADIASDAGALAPAPETTRRDLRFFRTMVLVMAVLLVLGFVVQLAAGRSSFAAPLLVHAHAVVAMGWVAITIVQASLPAAGILRWHRLLGRVAVVWALVFTVLAVSVTIARVRSGSTPFIFQPQHFVLANPASMLAALGLLLAAVGMRRRTDWHARLHIGALALLMGPGLGRLLPMPLLMPFAWESAVLAGLLFPVFGAVRDLRVRGEVHPAWLWPIALGLAMVVGMRILADSPAGDALFSLLAAGSAVEGVNGMAFPVPPGR